jgi:hypothetical protein
VEKNTQRSLLVPLLFGGLPVLVYFGFLAAYAVNVPLFDDHALRHFLVKYQATGTFAERFALIFSQHNEHRIGYDRLVVLGQFLLTGEINFVGMMVVGNLSLLGLLWVFYRVFARTGRSLWAFVPVPYLLFSLVLHENTFWGMAALQNFTVVFFVVLTLYHLARSTRHSLLWGCLGAVAAVYTSGNGFLLLPVGMGMLVVRRRWRDALLFSAVSAVCVGLYFTGYLPPPGNPDRIPLTEAGPYGRGLLLFLGAVGDGLTTSAWQRVPVLAAGVLLLAGAIWIAARLLGQLGRPTKEASTEPDLFLGGLVAFVLLTAVVVVYGRLSFGEHVLLTSRYKIYSVLLAIAGYLALLRVSRLPGWVPAGVLVGAVCWNVAMLRANLPEVVFHRKEMLTNVFNWTYSDNRLPPTDGYDRLRHPHRRPVAFYTVDAPLLLRPVPPGEPLPTPLTRAELGTDALVVDDPRPVPSASRDAGVYLLLKSPTRTFLFPTRYQTPALPGLSAQAAGFSGAVPATELPTGTYTLYLYEVAATGHRLWHTGRQVALVNPGRAGIETNW